MFYFITFVCYFSPTLNIHILFTYQHKYLRKQSNKLSSNLFSKILFPWISLQGAGFCLLIARLQGIVEQQITDFLSRETARELGFVVAPKIKEIRARAGLGSSTCPASQRADRPCNGLCFPRILMENISINSRPLRGM